MSKTDLQKKKRIKTFSVFKGVRLPWLLIAATLVSSIIMMSAEIQIATLTTDIIDTSQKAINSKVLVNYIGMATVTAVFTILDNYFNRKTEEVISLRVRNKLWDRIMGLPTCYYDTDNGNELVTRVTSDASAPADLITLFISCIVCVVTTVQAFTRLFSYNGTLAVYSLIIIPITIIISIVFAFLQYKLGIYSTVTLAGSLGFLAERVRNFRLIKCAVMEKAEAEKGNRTFKEMYKAEFLSWLIVAGYQLSSSLFSILFIVIVFVIGGRLIPSGEATIGMLTGFYMVTGIVSMQLMQLFMNIGAVWGSFGTMNKIAMISSTETESEEGEKVPETSEDLIFRNVDFSYDERKVIKGLNVRIPAGKVTAVIGGNGAGKSTLFKLITRLYEPESGEILFGSNNIRDYNLREWRDKFSYVFQDNPLIEGTVRENIMYGIKREVSDEELVSAAKKANCYDFIMEKRDGFEENVGMDGSNFSGGQGQCISIARAMLRNSDYLLLDEATSNLDPVSEAQVTTAIDKLKKNKTTIMIAHSYQATRNADYVIIMKDGEVSAAGTPEELLATNEYYQTFSITEK